MIKIIHKNLKNNSQIVNINSQGRIVNYLVVFDALFLRFTKINVLY